ncbi:urea carboxylase [Orrella sp. JC864]|uniref:urea carboxylase n=1 Tax=Orrella sp. JC864 TaxID=3120298 RepID=UPI003008A15A
MFQTVLIANRGEIAVRAIRTLKRLGVRSVAVYSDPDRNAAHVRQADTAVALGGEKAADSYLCIDKLLAAARQSGAQAIYPGYGFLSESAEFAQACEQAGIAFVGPTPGQMREFGLKHRARELAAAAGVPMTPGTGLLADAGQAIAQAQAIGYPVMLKSTAGGGGIGLTRCDDAQSLRRAFETVQRMGKQFFSDGGAFIERYVQDARHVEVQIFGDGRGKVVALGERDCSVQRRNQKVIEETPAPGLPEATRRALHEAAVRLGESVSYRSAGTVEFIYDAARDAFYFLEVNTRLQVEHPVTEAVTGLDLIECMLRVAAGDALDWDALARPPQGAAIEVRLYAEDPVRQFQPSPGVLTDVFFPDGVRVDGWVSTGTEVPSFYDPMLAKLIVHGQDRAQALQRLSQALGATRLAGIATNLDYLRQVVADPRFVRAELSTRFLDDFVFRPHAVEVVQPGTYTSVQDYPGRLGYWHIGVPPSGPMDDYAFRLANRIVGNHPDAAGLEATLAGPTLRFHGEAVIALTGGVCPATLDGEPVPFWRPVGVRAGQALALGRVSEGCRTYLAVRGGLDVPLYLGSRSTFALGQFGGHAGRILRAGDMLALAQPGLPASLTPAPVAEPAPAPPELVPAYGSHWEIGVLYGPHGAPDFFTPEAIETFFDTDWEVHYNSNRLGVRLLGPKPTWARTDGGEAGLHPSNIHDCEYAIGSINFTGDSPVILTRDGPSLGGFVCPATIAKAELWKVGQVKPGDRIRFKRIGYDQAVALQAAQDRAIETLAPAAPPIVQGKGAAGAAGLSETVLAHLPAEGSRPAVAYRQAGDGYILLEYGQNVLDLALRMRVHLLMQALEAAAVPGVQELSPGVRSLQIRYDSRVIGQGELVRRLLRIEQSLADVDTLKVPTRVVHLPMAFEDEATLGAVQRYRETVRAKAPWLPNNIDFIQRINGLPEREDVRRVVFEASYMVLGLGDVYLGAPCAVPVDPRHRLLTSKYNPARTFTAEGTVGIGGVYMCIYGMDSPGGYQLVGRTLPIWNKFLDNSVFEDGKPWLLRFFDQVRFYPVSQRELDVLREDFRAGRAGVRIEEEVFDFAQYRRFLQENAQSIEAFARRQQVAYQAEVALWQADEAALPVEPPPEQAAPPETVQGHAVQADMCGSVWKVVVEPGQAVKAGDTLVVIEAMKMELAVTAPVDGVVAALRCAPGKAVVTGDTLAVLAEPAGPSRAGWTLSQWQQAYRSGKLELDSVLADYAQAAGQADPAFIHRPDAAALAEQARELAQRVQASGQGIEAFPLYGIPFVVKDNIDVAGWPTTAACPAYAYTAQEDAEVVRRLKQAGAIVVGKANLDQFATGLVGTRSPHGPVPNSFDARYVSGGSSSGSASVVARGLVPFSLGTDTAGSGRVPAAFNNIVGLKPTLGWFSGRGAVPACRTLDCISVFALTVQDAQLVAHLAGGYDAADPYSRARPAAPVAVMPALPRIAVPSQCEFFGDELARAHFERALQALRELGAKVVPIDFAPFAELAELLYQGPWVAERHTVVQAVLERDPQAVDPVVRGIVEQASRYSATDAFRAEYRRAELTRAIHQRLAQVDALMVPTTPSIYTIEALRKEPVLLNSRLGIYTNFTNLADLSALAVPAGLREDGLPAGVTFIAPAWHDDALAELGRRWQRAFDLPPGVAARAGAARPGAIRVAVVGAHLRGMPLNHQLTSRNAVFVEQCRSACDYRLYALPGTVPPKPGLARMPVGACIELELWDVPAEAFGSFVAEIPAPLGIGTITLEDGREVKGFICEPRGLEGAADITEFGGWRAYLASRPPAQAEPRRVQAAAHDPAAARPQVQA